MKAIAYLGFGLAAALGVSGCNQGAADLEAAQETIVSLRDELTAVTKERDELKAELARYTKKSSGSKSSKTTASSSTAKSSSSTAKTPEVPKDMSTKAEQLKTQEEVKEGEKKTTELKVPTGGSLRDRLKRPK